MEEATVTAAEIAKSLRTETTIIVQETMIDMKDASAEITTNVAARKMVLVITNAIS